MYGLSRLNTDVARSSTLIYSSGPARLGGCTMNYLVCYIELIFFSFIIISY